MRSWSLAVLGIFGAASALGGCGSSEQSAVPLPGRWPQGALPARARPAESWMAEGLKQRDLLYVSNVNGTVNVYRYWQRTLVGVLTEFQRPMGECADPAGNVYITDYVAKRIVEYSHGGKKPLKVITDRYSPYGCSVDPVNGNLAVANAGNYRNPYVEGTLAVYTHARGKPTLYKGAYNDHFLGCAYDDRGDLLSASFYGRSTFYSHFYYLPKFGKTLVPMNLQGPSKSWNWGIVQGLAWDGKYWVVADGDLYRYTIDVKPQYIDTITLNGSYVPDIWIYRQGFRARGSQVVGANGGTGEGTVYYWKYPAGGNAIGTITKDLDRPVAVAVSLGMK
jgi:hypothetical protein